jgi:hypothetical protein
MLKKFQLPARTTRMGRTISAAVPHGQAPAWLGTTLATIQGKDNAVMDDRGHG